MTLSGKQLLTVPWSSEQPADPVSIANTVEHRVMPLGISSRRLEPEKLP
jgi:hypothetical protein